MTAEIVQLRRAQQQSCILDEIFEGARDIHDQANALRLKTQAELTPRNPQVDAKIAIILLAALELGRLAKEIDQ